MIDSSISIPRLFPIMRSSEDRKQSRSVKQPLTFFAFILCRRKQFRCGSNRDGTRYACVSRFMPPHTPIGSLEQRSNRRRHFVKCGRFVSAFCGSFRGRLGALVDRGNISRVAQSAIFVVGAAGRRKRVFTRLEYNRWRGGGGGKSTMPPEKFFS